MSRVGRRQGGPHAKKSPGPAHSMKKPQMLKNGHILAKKKRVDFGGRKRFAASLDQRPWAAGSSAAAAGGVATPASLAVRPSSCSAAGFR